MPTNYKYIDHEQRIVRRSWRGRVLFLLLVLLFIAAVTYGLYFWQTRKTDELILTGQYAAANEQLDHWTWLPLVNGRVSEKIGTAQLLEKNSSASAARFQLSESRPFFRPISIWPDVLKILWSRGRYEDGAAYTAHLDKAFNENPVLHYYKAGFFTGLNKLPEASKELALAGALPEFQSEISLLKTEIEHRTGINQYPFLFDRENLQVLNLTPEGTPVFLNQAIRPILANSAFNVLSRLPDRRNQAVLSLDYRIQNAAVKALERYAGAIVLLDVKNGDILAAASSLKGVNSSYPEGTQLAFLQPYEPGSIIKMITLGGSLEKGVDLSKIFPLQCEGYLKLPQDKILYDWKKHETVKDINAATAVSCNVAFAKMGLAMNPSDLLANLKQFGFNAKLQSDLFSADLGKIIDGDMTDLYISNISIGLEHLSMTPLHTAMLASAIANEGVAVTPRLLLQQRNVIGIPFGIREPAEFRRFLSASSAATITRAMQEVVTNSEGTGRRAAVEGFPYAMKTGTAGDGATGYNAIIIGFGPLPNPKIAFSIVLEHAGKAEFEGARVTRLFLESIQGYIK